MDNIVVFVFKRVNTDAQTYCLFLDIFEEEETLGINGKGEYNFMFSRRGWTQF